MAFVEPEYKGLKEKRKKERGDSKKKKISFLVPPNPTLILILRIISYTSHWYSGYLLYGLSLWELSYKIVYGLWKRRFEREGERNLGARHHARARMEKENLSSFLARPSCSSHDRNPLSLPFRTPARVRMTRHACPTLCGDRIRLLCFGSQLYLIWAISGSCDDDGYVVSNQLFDVFVFVTGIRKCRTYSDMWRTYQQNGWPSIVRGTCQWLVYGLRLLTSC